MGIEVTSAGGAFFTNNTGWMVHLALAHMHGWRPAGTSPPPEWYWPSDSREWNGSYTSNDLQLIEESDARAFAAALERALNAITDYAGEVVSAPDDPYKIATGYGRAELMHIFSGRGNQAHVRELIGVLRSGPAVIS